MSSLLNREQLRKKRVTEYLLIINHNCWKLLCYIISLEKITLCQVIILSIKLLCSINLYFYLYCVHLLIKSLHGKLIPLAPTINVIIHMFFHYCLTLKKKIIKNCLRFFMNGVFNIFYTIIISLDKNLKENNPRKKWTKNFI